MSIVSEFGRGHVFSRYIYVYIYIYINTIYNLLLDQWHQGGLPWTRHMDTTWRLLSFTLRVAISECWAILLGANASSDQVLRTSLGSVTNGSTLKDSKHMQGMRVNMYL